MVVEQVRRCSGIRPCAPTRAGGFVVTRRKDERNLGLERLAQLCCEELAQLGFRTGEVDNRDDLRLPRSLNEAPKQLVAAVKALSRVQRRRGYSFSSPFAPRTRPISPRVDARQCGRGIAEGGDDRFDLTRGERIAEPRTPCSAVEEHDCLGLARKLPRGFVDRRHRAANDRLRLVFADIHRRVRLDARRTDQTASGARPRT